MNTLKNLLLLGALLCGVVSTAQAGVARHRFQCDLLRQEGVQGYMKYQFYGYIYPASKEVSMTYSLTDRNGKNITGGDLKTTYAISNGKFIILVARPDGVTTKLAISKDLFSLPAAPVAGDFDGLNLGCYLMFTQLPSSAASLPKTEFEKYDLPVTYSGNLPVKTWTSSDRVFNFTADLINDYTNKRGNLVRGWTDLRITFLGAVVDDAKDVSRYVYYVQYGNEKRTLRATLTNPTDVKKIISIFHGNKVSLNLVHSIGGTTPVNLQIDCTSGTACVVTSQN